MSVVHGKYFANLSHTHWSRSGHEYLVLSLRHTSLVIWAAGVSGSSRGPTLGRKNTTNTLRPFVSELKSSLGFSSQSASRGVTGLTKGSRYVWHRPEVPWHVSVCVTACWNIYQVNFQERADVSVEGEHVDWWLCTLVTVSSWEWKEGWSVHALLCVSINAFMVSGLLFYFWQNSYLLMQLQLIPKQSKASSDLCLQSVFVLKSP